MFVNGTFILVTVIVIVGIALVTRKTSAISKDGHSNTLHLVKLSSFFILTIVALDTINDVVMWLNSLSSATTKPAPGAAIRAVAKEKYYLLGFMFLVSTIAYYSKHPKVVDFAIRLIAAWKGSNPYPDKVDPLDQFIMQYLKDTPTSDNEDWFVRVLMARKGTNPFPAQIVTTLPSTSNKPSTEEPH